MAEENDEIFTVNSAVFREIEDMIVNETKRKGTSDKLVSSLVSNLAKRVDAIDFRNYKGGQSGDPSSEEQMFGAYLFEEIDRCLNEYTCIKSIVKHHFNLAEFIETRQQLRVGYEDVIQQLQQAEVENAHLDADQCTLEKAIAKAEFKIRREIKGMMEAAEAAWKKKPKKMATRGGAAADQAITEVPDVFTSSEDYREVMLQIEMIEKARTDRINDAKDDYFIHDEEVQEWKKQKGINRASIARAQRLQEEETIIEIYVNAMQTAINNITNKLKAAVNGDKYVSIRSKLSNRVSVGNYTIVDPLNEGNLSGMMAILSREYTKPNLVSFCKLLIDLLKVSYNAQASDADPYNAVQQINNQLKMWQQLKLARYLDEDKLMTIALLRSWHEDSEIRKKANDKVIEFAAVLDETPGDSASLPLYSMLIKWFHDHYEKSKQLNAKNHIKGSYNNGGASKFGARSAQYNNGAAQQAQSKGVERAALAKEAKPSSKAQQIKEVTGIFDREVMRSERYMCKSPEDGSFRHLYTATLVACQKCITRDPTQCCDGQRCYIHQCKRCRMYGHKKSQCHQKVDEDGHIGEEEGIY